MGVYICLERFGTLVNLWCMYCLLEIEEENRCWIWSKPYQFLEKVINEGVLGLCWPVMDVKRSQSDEWNLRMRPKIMSGQSPWCSWCSKQILNNSFQNDGGVVTRHALQTTLKDPSLADITERKHGGTDMSWSCTLWTQLNEKWISVNPTGSFTKSHHHYGQCRYKQRPSVTVVPKSAKFF